MKPLISAFLLTASCLLGGPEDYVNFLRQTQLDTFVEWDMPIDATGTMRPPEAVGDAGAVFELLTVHGPTAEDRTLASRLVAKDMPEISVTIETGDPYARYPRTRIDQPFTVRMALAGMNASLYKKLHLSHLGYQYPDGEYTLDDSSEPTPQFHDQYTVGQTGEIVMSFASPTLEGEDLTKTQGLEVFRISALIENNGHGNNGDHSDGSNPGGDAGGDDPSGSLDDETFGGRWVVGAHMDEARLQVWPVAEATISGLDPNKRYTDVPPVTVDLLDLYPDSTTYVRAYRGAPGSGARQAIEIGSACTIVRDSIPRDRTLFIEDLGEFLPKSGSYTIEVVHETPFGAEVLTQFYPLQVDWSIEVRGMLYTQK